MAVISRAIKQELLDNLHPEFYDPPKPRRRAKVKTEERVDVKTIVKEKTKRRRAAKKRGEEEEVEFVRSFAPRRPYQWKGRKVRAVVRPGMPVVFTPGQRTGKAQKREYDEVYADADILDQAGAMVNEFAYGKRARLLTERNPTPSQVPITEQEPVARPGEARLLPTVQVLAPRDQREVVLPVTKSEVGDVKVENKGVEKIAPGLGVQTVDIKVPIKRKIKEEDHLAKRVKEELEPYQKTVHMEYLETPDVEFTDKGVEPGTLFQAAPAPPARALAVPRRRRRPVVVEPAAEAMEVVAPVSAPAPAAPVAAAAAASASVGRRIMPGTRVIHRWGPANAIIPDYRYHPSITAPKVRRPPPRGRVSRWGPANSIIPEVRLHPSIVAAIPRGAAGRTARTRRRRRAARTRRAFVLPATTKSGAVLPQNVRYHPSIGILRRA
ncbi:V [Bat adenovirus 2]|uniref:V n=1 Tax=Bat adenovirus 2 TaxID=696069 RepID=G1FQM5_9ADEN|nr:V [Bat adenovirus 2] [Bat adenovirus 2]AEM06272.1 V [Bat adenovirus 2] [Bat adenovirus 2]